MSTNPEHAPQPEIVNDAPRIYVASLADYNAGVLHGTWVDATRDLDELQADISRMLAASPTTPTAEEYAIHDHQGFGQYRVGEYTPIARVHAIARGIEEHGLAFAAWLAHANDGEDALDRFADVYLGEYDSAVAYTEELLDDCGLQRIIDEHIPESLQAYVTIDAEAFARDLQLGGDIAVVEQEHGVWIFDPNG